jgi:hypothetical protein
MSTALAIAGVCVALFLAGYAVLALTLGYEGRRLVDLFVRLPRAPADRDEERIYMRRSPRRRRQSPNYEVPAELEFENDLGGGQMAPPPAAWDGRNPDA